MLLEITTTHRPATDLGFLLHKHPERVHTRDLPFGTASVFYPEATDDRCTAALLLEMDQWSAADALLARWRHWWQAIFPVSAFWRRSKARFMPPVAALADGDTLLDGDPRARERFQRAVDLAQGRHNRHQQAWALTYLGHALAGLGRLDEAADAYRQTEGRHWVLGTGCVTMVTTPTRNLRALRAFVETV